MKFFLFFAFFCSRLFAIGAPENFEDYYCLQTEKPFFRISQDNGVQSVYPDRSGALDFKFSAVPGKRKRIFIEGESTGYFLYTPYSSPQEPFNRQKDFEMLNFSMIGYESERIRKVALESLVFNPAALILFSGNNEWLFDPCRGKLNELKRRYFYINRRIYDFWGRGRERLFNISVYRHLSNLGKIKLAASRARADVFLVIMPSNLLFPPFGRRPYSLDYLKGYEYFDSGDYSKALEIFLSLLKKDSSEPFANYYAGLSLYRSAKTEEAFAYLERAAAFDNRMDRTTPLRNSMLRAYAAKNGIKIVDIEKTFMDLSSSRIISSDFFNDGAHWDGIYNCHVQSEILKALSENYGTEKPDFICPSIKTRKDRLNSAKFLSHQDKIIDERVIYDMEKYLEIHGLEKVFSQLIRNGLKNIISPDSLSSLEKTGKTDLFLTHFAEAFRRLKSPEKAMKILSIENHYFPDEEKLAVLALSAKDAGRPEAFRSVISDYSNRLVPGDMLKSVMAFSGFGEMHFPARIPRDREKAKIMSDMAVEKIKNGDITQALKNLESALSADPYDFESLMNASYCFYLRNDPARAIFYLEGITENPYAAPQQFCPAVEMLENIFNKFKMKDKAVSAAEKARRVCGK
ncbi:MAG: hypothetical protein Fur0012_14710 [Elusimicrobiota bacterium]